MADEIEREPHSPDVLSAEEFLSGNPSGDAPAEAVPYGEAADDAAAGIAEEQDAGTETAAELDVAGDAGDAAAQPEELKVILSIRTGRATIGVQQPSADPHIESFEDPDLFDLADQFPAVVARARAKWEEEPMHPAYDRPAPPARQRNRRQQAAPPPAEAETLRLLGLRLF